MSRKTATLCLNCKDVKGIASHVSVFIYQCGGNVITSHQHFEALDSQFFMRVHFEITDCKMTNGQLREAIQALADKFEMPSPLDF